MRIAIIANNSKWKSWDKKIAELKEWFAPEVDINFTLTHTDFNDVPFSPYEDGRLGVDPKWYDENITWRGVGSDMVLFVLPKKQWKDLKNVRGWRSDSNQGPVQLQIACDENDKSGSGGWLQFDKKMSAFFLLAVHEILHGCFMLSGQVDVTHYYWDKAQLEKARDGLILKETYRRGILVRSLIYIQNLLNKKLPVKNFNEKLHQLSFETVGKDASPSDLANDEVGCAESLSTLINHLDPSFPVVTGTYSLRDQLEKRWKRKDGPAPGRVAICATGTGNGKRPGHCWVAGTGEGNSRLYYSNNSIGVKRGQWLQNYTQKTIFDDYVVGGGFELRYYEHPSVSVINN